jgi:hypothetical protein
MCGSNKHGHIVQCLTGTAFHINADVGYHLFLDTFLAQTLLILHLQLAIDLSTLGRFVAV